MLKAWILLILAIITEVIAVSVLNYSNSLDKIYVYSFLFFMILVSYYLMSLAIRKISVGIAYAMWEIVGTSLIAIISIFIFDVSLKTQEYIGLALAILGIILVNLGEVKEENHA